MARWPVDFSYSKGVPALSGVARQILAAQSPEALETAAPRPVRYPASFGERI
jgi:hypothetical protein